MSNISSKFKNLAKRKKKIRAKIFGSQERPRLSVFRSNKHIFLQLINDAKGTTILSFSDLKIGKKEKISKTESAKIVGKKLAELAKEKKIKEVVFDRGGYKYHGRVKAVAEAVKEEGLKI